MTFRQLAFSNVRGSLLRYAAFFLSSVFSVALFLVYTQFVMHPDVVGGYIYGGRTARTALQVCQWLIVLFSFVFVAYSNSAFQRARHKEFGLLSLMGIGRGQLRRLIWWENTLLSGAAVAVGILVGLLFSRLFLMAISKALQLEAPIRFLWVPQAILLTVVLFVLLFQVITLLGLWRVGRAKVIDLLGAARRPKRPPRASLLLFILAVLLLIAGYAAAVLVPPILIVFAFFPVVGMVTLGTYLLFGQGSVWLLFALQRRPRIYLRGTRMLVISELVFRMRDNARLLATLATLSAVVLSAAGSFYVGSRTVAADVERMAPQALTVRDQVRAFLPASEVSAILARHGVRPTLAIEVAMIDAEPLDEGRRFIPWLLSRSTYLALQPTATLANLGADEAWVVDPGPAAGLGTPEAVGTRVALRVGSVDRTLEIVGQEATALLRSQTSPWWVVADATFADMWAEAPDAARRIEDVYDWPATRASAAIAASLDQVVPEELRPLLNQRWTQQREAMQVLSLTMLVGVFISGLFFVGAGSIIYFKLFTELPDDRRLHASLRRIGVTWAETSRVVSQQVALVFALPILVGGVHAAFALQTLGNALMVDVAGYVAVVIALFAAVQAVFFLLTRWTYLRALRGGVAPSV